MFLKLAYKSLMNRRDSIFLSVLALTVSTFVLLGVEHIRSQSKESFSKAVSGTDLIVGARSGPINLLLYSVFHMGSANNNLSWQSYQAISQHPKVQWAIPLSMGDSHRGYRVIASNNNFFAHFRYGQKQALQFETGKAFESVFDVVLGAQVAKKLNYKVGDTLLLSHGHGARSFGQHDDYSFTVSGVLDATGTAIDRSIVASLAGIEIIHDKNLAQQLDENTRRLANSNIETASITAFMLGLERKIDIFKLQRHINNYPNEALTAILPGVTLQELWQMMGNLENSLRLISHLVLSSAILGLIALQMANARQRQAEVTLLRMIGASPGFIFMLVQLEVLLMALLSICLGGVFLYLSLRFGQQYLSHEYGLFINTNLFSIESMQVLLLILAAALLAASWPALKAYRQGIASAH